MTAILSVFLLASILVTCDAFFRSTVAATRTHSSLQAKTLSDVEFKVGDFGQNTEFKVIEELAPDFGLIRLSTTIESRHEDDASRT
jgi:hypothetical protein